MKKIFELIKKLLGSGSTAEKAVQLTQLETEVKKEVAEVKEEVKEIKLASYAGRCTHNLGTEVLKV